MLAAIILSACDLLAAGEATCRTAPDIEATVTAAVQVALAIQVAASATPTTRGGTGDIAATLSAESGDWASGIYAHTHGESESRASSRRGGFEEAVS